MRFRLLALVIVWLMSACCATALAAESEPVEAPIPPEAFTRGVEVDAFPGSAILLGFIENHGIPTDWRFQVGRTKAYGRHVGEAEEGPAYNLDAPVGVERLVGRLRPGKTYHYRLVAWNEAGRSVGRDRTFRAPR
jgi:phosphodiesterase/alkaline phosphatase D-like protein